MRERIIDFPKIEDRRGNLSFAEALDQIPFNIARVYWIYDVPGGQVRGSHAFKSQEEVIIALSGSFDVVLDNGTQVRRHTLNRSYKGLYVPSKMWRSLENFSTNSVCLIITSEPFDEDDYIRNYRDFKRYIKQEPLSEGNNTVLLKNRPSKEPFNPANNTVYDCNLIELPVIRNRAGNITPIHNSENIPFDIARVFYIYDIPSGQTRGGHAHKYCHQFLIAVSGSFDVELDDGVNKRIVTLNRPMMGLYLPPGIWAVEKNFSSGAVSLVLTSHIYESEDYIRKYSDFKNYKPDVD
ncbi:WxcM-like domain-containing protein [Dysgonomonas sp. 216]|uniref:sugar 3,4-ketoisomerase n=1 Tax=Dysgonomonas sp. 216 TaxID=2302934 RepID=UPI0013D651BA|nr:FdtA/QdtA family cupin domain-containing protein [Dysgonomonas sp. 216]NDW17703.1 WxcM-like domain-containing protein [Dysgonomonas sp. 216]